MISDLVVDANMAVGVLGMGPDRHACLDLFARWMANQRRLCSPALCLYEVTSTISKAVRFGGLTVLEARRALALFESLSIELIPPNSNQVQLAFDWTVRLNRAAAYDSFYLALAQELGCELWTADRRLCEAVNAPWVRSPFD